ncbi:nuclear protein 96-domain-containing protein [Collybia nuda]|uniref:Nuclear protein 96-domain-containing protein n=1 Tax=Collybia nuda TaxID=64659 RepID=A0A9P5XYM4_9AGAR|nr:nuclear protein 96-domain-containing protein [Collybia nuda]
MARFRAYTSDSSDEGSSSEPEAQELHVDEEEEEDESDQESTGASSSSDMQEDELFTSPSRPYKRPNRNALVEDEDGEIRYAHEVEDDQRLSVRVSPASSSSPPPPRNRGDPTMIPWAQHVGVDAQKMHVMQTSLFRMPEEAAALKAMNQQTKPNLRVPLQSLSRKHSRDSDGDGLRFEPRERPSFAHNIDPPAYRPSRKYARVESSESAVHGNEGVVVDAGLALGRSFRVGWGPGGTLVHLGKLCGPSSTIKTSANSATITSTTVPTVTNAAHVSDLSSKLLQHHLSNSPIEPDDDGIPFAAPSSALNFASFASLFPSTDRSYEASVFRLGEALFDEIDLHLGSSITVDIRNRVIALRRKAALSAWLEDAVIPALEADLRSNPSASSSTVAFTFLTGNQVDKACASAMDGGYLKLATLISQAGGDFDFREDLKEQLQIWRDERIDVHIDEGVRKVYTLLSGVVGDVIEGSKGGGLEKCSDIDVTKGLDWKRIFGLHLWFSEPIDAPIGQVFRAYDQLTKDASRQVSQPVPWYAEQTTNATSSSSWNLPSQPSLPDGLFSLIRLHAEPACSLSQILSPLSFGSSPVDYSMAWHLYIILSRCMGVRDFADRGEPVGRSGAHTMMDDDEDQEEDGIQGHSPSADLLASMYAFQLESLGMVQEALFVLLHIEGPAGREKAIKDLLARTASKLDEWMTRGVVGSLKIPMAWVNEAKAMYALDKGDMFDAYQLFISAGLYNPAHDLAVLELAPDAVIRKDLDLLKEIFSKFVGRPVDGWHIRGQAFLDYVHIMTRLPELQAEQAHNTVADASQATEIDELTRSVSKLIGILPDVLRNTSDIRHRAALSEMVAGLVAQVDKVRPLALSKVQPMLSDETTKLRHIHSLAFARFQSSLS